MDRRIILDLETKRTFDEVGGRDHLGQLEVSVAAIYDYATQEFHVFEEREIGKLQNVLINSSLIVGFNHVNFDLPVLQPYLSIDVKTLPVFDIMLDFQAKTGHRIGLDSLAQATLGVGKTGYGIDAIRYFREGKMKELRDYCVNDVKVTRDLFNYGLENEKIFYFSKMGNQKKEMIVDWKKYRRPKKESTCSKPAQYKLF